MNLRIYNSVPWWFDLIRQRIARQQRGPWLMLRLARQFGLLNAAAHFPLNNETILVPLYWPDIYLPEQLKRFEPEAVSRFASEISAFRDKAVLIDCGADIGLFSRLVMQQTSNLSQVALFEPNRNSHAILEQNFASAAIPACTINAGVSNFNGFAVLENLSPNQDPHSGFIRPAESGIPVATIDSLNLPPGKPLALKIDVEGEELHVLQGAERTIREASEFIIQLEAAKTVARRTNQEPTEMLRALREMRPCQFTCFEENTSAVHPGVDLDRPFFSQFPDEYHVVDVIARST